MPPGDIAPVFVTSLLAVCTAAVLILRGPVGRAFETWLTGRKGGSGLEGAEMDEVKARLDSVQELEQRVYELEERLEFTERLLASANKAAKIEH